MMLDKFRIILTGPICKCKKQSLYPRYFTEGGEISLRVVCASCNTVYNISTKSLQATSYFIELNEPYPEGLDEETRNFKVQEINKKSQEEKDRQNKIKADDLKSRAEQESKRRMN